MGNLVHYCPKCGRTYIHKSGEVKCAGCGMEITLVPSKYELVHYANKSAEIYQGDRENWKEFLMEEIIKNPLYDPNLYNSPESQKYRQIERARKYSEMSRAAAAQRKASLPKCPLCGSTKLKKISAVKRGIHAAAFGIFSKTAFSQFECESCHYKF